MVMMLGNGYGFNWKGLYVTSLVDAHSAWRERADEAVGDAQDDHPVRQVRARHKYRGHYYAKAQNLARRLGCGLRPALAKCDLLLMPTLPLRAAKLPDPARPAHGHHQPRLRDAAANTAPFDVTGHPAITLAVRRTSELPAGMMLVGKRTGTRSTIYRCRRRLREKPD